MNQIPLRVIPANDVVAALLALTEALEGKCAVFISPREINGGKVKIEGLPEFVDENTALIVESSGSTGIPKLVSIEWNSIFNLMDGMTNII